MQSSDLFSDFLIQLAAGLTQKLIEAAGSVVKRTFAGDEQQQALQAALIEALAEALGSFELAEDIRTELQGIFQEFFYREEVLTELSQLIDPRPDSHLDFDLLRREFLAAERDPDALPGFELDEFLVRFTRAFEAAAERQTLWQGVRQTRLLHELVENSKSSAKSLKKINREMIRLAGEHSPEKLLQAYYRALAADCGRLPLGVIDDRMVKTTGEIPIPLPDIYIDLDVINPPAPGKKETERTWALRLQRAEGQERKALLKALQQTKNRKAVLLGEAGSGKTTFVNYLAYLAAASFAELRNSAVLSKPLKDRLPIRLVLRDAARHIIPDARRGNAQVIWKALQEDISAHLGEDTAGLLLDYLRQRLLKEGGLVLLDGLDEVPDAGRRRAIMLEAVADFCGLLPEKGSLILVTARPYAYADNSWRLPGFSTLSLAAFSEEQEKNFIERFYKAARPSLGWSETEATGRATRLQDALSERTYLADLASRPLLLTLMATLHASYGQLPDDRADLYEQAVGLLLNRWQQARQIVEPDGTLVADPGILQASGVGVERLRSVLETLAYRAHERQGKGDQRDDAPADISEPDVLVAFEPLLEQCSKDKLLFYLKERAGLLIARREGLYAFPHRSFQEYLAGCYLANQPEFAEQLEKLVCVDPQWWREVCLLGIGKARQGGLGQAASVVNILLPDDPPPVKEIPDNQWRVAALAGQALIELRVPEKAGEQKYYQTLLKRSQSWLVALLHQGSLNAAERAAAGNALAALGDPRFDPQAYCLPREPRLGFLEVPAGMFIMGSDPKKDKYAREEEQLQHEVDLPLFYIAHYPVTNAQFESFTKDGGYGEIRFWHQAIQDKTWKDGKVIRRVYKGDKPELVEEFANKPVDFGAPYNLPNHPVAGICWYEALAYCHWLTEKLCAMAQAVKTVEERSFWEGFAQAKLVINLPSEAEWEKAARGIDGRIYPWSGDFDPDKANMYETGLNATSPVGCFPKGASPCEALDMSGNVWEWTRSLWGEKSGYPYHPGKEREDLGAGRDVARVLRGGCYFDNRRYTRCAYRDWYFPGAWNGRFGFRVVALPISVSEL